MGIFNLIRRRAAGLLVVLLGVSVITFSISHLIPGDPARLIAGDRATEEVISSIRQQLGLDQPLYQQYVHYMLDLFHGDLGTSIRTSRSVAQDLETFFPATLELAVSALILSCMIGIPLGVLSAVYRNQWIDQLARLISIIGISTPTFWLALGMIMLFYGHFGVLPGGGRLDQGLVPPVRHTGFLVADCLIAGDFKLLINALKHLLLPTATLAFVNVGIISRQVRSAMMEQLEEDYIRTARAFGLSRAYVIMHHALPNALIPTVTVIGLALGDLLYGAVLTETVFSWPGMGAYVVDSIQALDFPAVMGFAIVVSIAYVIINILVDILYGLIDPRIKGGN